MRGQQLHDGLVKNGVKSLADFTNLSKTWRAELLEKGIETGRSEIYGTAASPDGTTKLLLKLHDGRVIETVTSLISEQCMRVCLCVCSHAFL